MSRLRNLAFLSYWSPLKSSRVVVARIENYSTSRFLKFSPEKAQILSCDTSEVCQPCCAFKLYGEVNSVKKHNYKLWLNDGVY